MVIYICVYIYIYIHTYIYTGSPSRISPTQGLNPGLLHCSQILYCLSHQGSPIYIHIYIYIHTII